MSSFLDQPGVPIVHAEVRCDGSPRVLLRQESAAAQGLWEAPVCVKGEGGSPQCVVMKERQAEIRLEARCPSWVFANAGAAGYYRGELPPGQWAALIDHGFEHLSAAERVTAAADLAALVLSGRLPAGEALALLPKLAGDPEPRVVLAAVNLARTLAGIVPAELRAKYEEYLRGAFGGRAAGSREEIEALRRAQEKSVVEFLRR